MSDVAIHIIEILAPIVMAGLTWLSAKLAGYIKAKTQNEYLSGVLARTNDAVLVAVREVEQTVVAEIKKAKADGKITDEERAQIKKAALDSVKSHFGSKGLAEAAKVLGVGGAGLDALLSSRIEAAVADMKTSQPARTPATLPAASSPR